MAKINAATSALSPHVIPELIKQLGPPCFEGAAMKKRELVFGKILVQQGIVTEAQLASVKIDCRAEWRKRCSRLSANLCTIDQVKICTF